MTQLGLFSTEKDKTRGNRSEVKYNKLCSNIGKRLILFLFFFGGRGGGQLSSTEQVNCGDYGISIPGDIPSLSSLL